MNIYLARLDAGYTKLLRRVYATISTLIRSYIGRTNHNYHTITFFTSRGKY